MIWIAATADRYEFPIYIENSAEALARKMNISRGSILSMEHRGRNNGQPGTGRKQASYRIYKVKD